MDFAKYSTTTFPLPSLGFTLELGRMGIPESFFIEKSTLVAKALAAMQALEAGAIANPDENRRVGHYWLRAPQFSPDEKTRGEIETTLFRVLAFSKKTHQSKKFKNLLVIGIGGSALGPQFVAQALDLGRANKLTPHFLDNTDPDGIDNTLSSIDLKKTLVVVISKSGSTPETRNGMLEVQGAFRRAKLNFPKHAVAVTQEGSQLDQLARREEWLERFPMWDFVGGRTSITSAVGLLPMALQGIDIGKFLEGAAAMDVATRPTSTPTIIGSPLAPKIAGVCPENKITNPAMLMALGWLFATGGVGAKAMVVLPYKDRLCLLTKYLQQLIMESLGKALDLDGKRVHQGLTVYGNKGSTDQHAYVQQLRDGLNNFFVTFVEVLRERGEKNHFEVDPGITSGDYLQGFCLGSAVALEENFRQSMTLTLNEVSEFSIGALIALYERAVGFYATLINVNAYHQPGVEAGKKAASGILKLKSSIVDALKNSPVPMNVDALASKLNAQNQSDLIYRILQRLCVNSGYGVKSLPDNSSNIFSSKYTYEAPIIAAHSRRS